MRGSRGTAAGSAGRGPGGSVVGDHDLWLEVQPRAILCGAATPGQARALLTIRAASLHLPDLAWDEWRRMTLHAHTAACPEVWTGTLSGPDRYLAPESDRPGETWALPEFGTAMQAYPVANLHGHSQPLLACLRLRGVVPRFGERA